MKYIFALNYKFDNSIHEVKNIFVSEIIVNHILVHACN